MEILAGSLLSPDTVNPTDFPLADCPVRTKRSRTEFDQLKLDPCACFYVAAICAAFDVYERRGDSVMQVILSGWEALKRDGKFIPGFGGRMADGVDYARRAYNAAYPNQQVASYRVDIDSLPFWRALARGWAPCIGRYASKSDIADIAADGSLDANVAGAGKFGHLFRVQAGPVGIDNYPGRPGWINKFKMPDFDKKVESGLLFPSAYIFLPRP